MKIGFLFEAKPSIILKDCVPDIYMEFENLEAIQKIASILEEIGHSVIFIDATKDIVASLKRYKKELNIVFNYSVGFGSRSREILPSAICEILKIPYTGSDPMAQALSAHKHVAKLIAKRESIPTPTWYVIQNNSDLQSINRSVDGYYIVKPIYEGSSIGITERSITNNFKILKEKVKLIQSNYKQPSLVEQFIEGYEITVPVIGTTEPFALSPVGLQLNGKLICGEKIFNSSLKSDVESVSWTTELPFSKPLIDKIKKWSERIHKAIGCRDLSRVDFRVTVDNKPYFLEINATPQLTPQGGTFAIAGIKDKLTFKDIIRKIIDSAEERYS